MNRLKKGLRLLPQDDRDFKLGAFSSLPKLEELPDELFLGETELMDQGQSDYCTAFTASTLNELQEMQVFSPEWIFAVSKMLSGDIDAWGQDLRTAMKVLVKHGALLRTLSPFSLENTSDQVLRNIKSWEETTFAQALPYRKKSYASVQSFGYSAFDAIRATLYKYRVEKKAVAIGVEWKWSLGETYLKQNDNQGFGHAVPVIGYKGDYLTIKNSAGKNAGKGGYHYIHKDIINEMVPKYGAYTVTDLSPEEVKYLIENGINAEDNWLVQLIKIILNFLHLR